MMKHDIKSREDVERLVNTFYGKVRNHPEIGPFFNRLITDWDEHLAKLADFWESTLFLVNRYKGNPMQAHREVDKSFGHTVEQAHFGHWLQLWFETLDELFEGPTKALAKERARNMAHIIFIRIFQARPTGE